MGPFVEQSGESCNLGQTYQIDSLNASDSLFLSTSRLMHLYTSLNPSLHNNAFGLQVSTAPPCSHGGHGPLLADFRIYLGEVGPRHHIYESHRVIKRVGDGSSESCATTGMETALRTPSPHFLG
jgi:hypothetical protein